MHEDGLKAVSGAPASVMIRLALFNGQVGELAGAGRKGVDMSDWRWVAAESARGRRPLVSRVPLSNATLALGRDRAT